MQTILTTENVQENERFTYWHDALCNTFVQLDAAQISSQSFSGRLKVGKLNAIEITEVTADSQKVIRSNKQIQKSVEDYFLVSLQLNGNGYIEQDNKMATLNPGDFTLYDSTRPYTLHFDQPFQQIVFQFPRPLLLERFKNAEQMTSLLFPGKEHPISTMVSTLLQTIALSYSQLDSSAHLRLVNTTLDMLTVAMSAISGVKVNEIHSMSDLYLTQAKSFILDHLNNPNLSPLLIAEALDISERYLHKLFESENYSVTSLIREQRLKHCRNDLSNIKKRHLTITEIAMGWGFNNSSHFSRIFKQRFNQSPSVYRNLTINKNRD